MARMGVPWSERRVPRHSPGTAIRASRREALPRKGGGLPTGFENRPQFSMAGRSTVLPCPIGEPGFSWRRLFDPGCGAMSQSQSQSELAAFRFWESVGEGPDTRAEIRFFGILKRIPVAAFPREPRELRRLALEWDESIETMRRDLGKTLPVSMQS